MLSAEQIESNRQAFLDNYERLSRYFRQRLFWNIDQTGIEYESSNQRTLATTGSRDVYLRNDSLNKNTHTYTGLPIISRGGRLIGKLALCMQEISGRFGPRIRPKVEKLERRYGKIRVYASPSGKMSADLMNQWYGDTMQDAIETHLFNATEVLDLPSRYPDNFPEDLSCVTQAYAEGGTACMDHSTFIQRLFGASNDTCLDIAQNKARHACNHPNILLSADSWL